jgi:hypothetical protein
MAGRGALFKVQSSTFNVRFGLDPHIKHLANFQSVFAPFAGRMLALRVIAELVFSSRRLIGDFPELTKQRYREDS